MESKKKSRKATPNGRPRYVNLVKNWLHQGVTYMDTGEKVSRSIVWFIEFLLVYCLVDHGMGDRFGWLGAIIGFVVVHTWNWATNGLFWALIIFAFPNLKNPGAERTVAYLNSLRSRLLRSSSIVAVAVYGSVVRGKWHERSDIDIRFVRSPGLGSLAVAAWITMRERFLAFLSGQPMDLFLADDVDFLKKMRSDEKPLLLLCSDAAVTDYYPDSEVREISMHDLISGEGEGRR